MKRALRCLSRLGVPVLVAVCVLAAPALADWNQGQPYKWVQMPDLSVTGIDVMASRPYLLADDFRCTVTGPLTDIHVWGSWYHDLLPFNDPNQVVFVLSIHSDIPKSPTNQYSRPGPVLWYHTFNPGQFLVRPYMTGIQEGWLTPPLNYEFPADTVCWQYNFNLRDIEPFVQQGTQAQPIVYWLDVQAMPIYTLSRFGWKTSLQHWNDGATWGQGIEPYNTGSWSELRYPTTHQMSGQSIDLAFVVNGEAQQPQIDWGDAPDPTYPTLSTSAGANHVIAPGMFLGALIDPEPDGQPTPIADGDDINGVDDEDGVVFTSPLAPGSAATIEVTASVTGMLDAWIDFNQDGDWADAGEQIFASQPLVAGLNPLSFAIPAATPSGNTFSRFRYSSAGGLSYTGPAANGEVEDYRVQISCFKWEQPPDLSSDGFDVMATNPFTLADDFLCTMPGPVTDIHVYGSWYGDQLPLGDPSQVVFTLSLHGDIPATPTSYSRPGQLLWTRTFGPGQFTVRPYRQNLKEGWLTPPNTYQPFADTICWRYDFYLDPGEFYQQGTTSKPIVYWLDVHAQPLDQTVGSRFGWKTSTRHWNDDAVWGTGTSCVLPDNGTGTADLPPVGCEYRTPNDDMRIVSGLPSSTTVEIDATHGNFVCSSTDGVCSFATGTGCRQPGGSLGGEKECFNSQLQMPMVGTGSLAGFNRVIALPVNFETHLAPRTLGAPIQSFDTQMFRLFGQLPPGDPDFDLLRVVAGTDFGLPSPGHTTLVQQPGGNWAVDSFFDITYRIDFVGHTGGALSGKSGSTTGTVRFQTAGSWGELRYPQGHTKYPQSLDLAFDITGDCWQQQDIDWGDAPDPTYPTLAANAGANHVIVPGMFLGALIDPEPDGQPTPIADGDDINSADDEDGVVFTSPLAPGSAATVDVTASVTGMLDAWIDFNQDGDWADAGEQIFASQPLVAGVNPLSFTIPAAAASGNTFARFRYSSAGGLSYTGPAVDGEVEDYRVQIWCYKWEQPPDLSPEGFDVMATNPFILADDFLCTMPGPVTDIHVYGSWYGDQLPLGDPSQVVFTLSLHGDIPATPTSHSRPGQLLWTRTFGPGQFAVRPYRQNLQEGWLTPPSTYQPFADTICWRYDFYLDPGEFYQQGTTGRPMVYWLDVHAQPLATGTRFGWKTSTRHWNDDAVWGTGTDCVAPDNGTGTASLPPPCPYDDVNGGMRIIDGLNPGDTIEMNTQLGEYSGASETSGGSFIGGNKQTYSASMPLVLTGTGSLNGFSRQIQMPVQVETHSAPRTPHDPIQSFDTDMFRLQGQLPIGDPDFDLLRITAGTGFGMPSPGHTTLTSIPGGNWAVDSFFDITYRIDFVGHPGGPLSGRSGSTTVTLRLQTVGLWSELRYPLGHPKYPQSLDLAFDITGDCWQQSQIDWGDAPDPGYPTLAASAGANHVIVPGMTLGALIDGEADGQPTPSVDGDDINGVDDEDGVVFTGPVVPGAPATVVVTASASGKLDAWIDFNADFDWTDPGEQIAAGVPLAAGPNTITFSVPTWAGVPGGYLSGCGRFRFSSTGGLSYTGPAADGEVEDYLVEMQPRPIVVSKGRAKCLPIGSFVMITKDVVTANFGPFGWYFEEPDRFAGLGVLPQPNSLSSAYVPDDLVNCYGYTVMNGCELMLQEIYSWKDGTGSVAPVGQNNRNSGGDAFCNQPGLFDDVSTGKPAYGLNSVAMLVRLWGRCTCYSPGGSAGTGDMWIDDGSGLWDGNTCGATAPAKGLRVRIPAGYAGPSIAVGKYYSITGVMRTYTSPQGLCVRWLWPRGDSDFVRVPE